MQAESPNTLIVHVDNLSEDVYPFIATLINGKRTFEIDENGGLADRCIFYYSGIDQLLLLVPRSIDDDFLQYFQNIFPKEYFQVKHPKIETGETSIDVLHDPVLLNQLSAIFSQYDVIKIASYSSTAQYYELVESLQKIHPNVFTMEAPTKEDSGAVNLLGSKAGLRKYRYSEDGSEYLPMCDGEIVYGVPEIVTTAIRYYKKYDGVVIKTNKGHAGMGVVIIAQGEMNENESLEKQIQARLTEEYWNIFPSVVEEFVDFDASVGGGFPNAECYVDEQGKVTYLYSCGMRVTAQGQFKGVEVGTNVLPETVEVQLRAFGDKLGTLFAQFGYVGYFDIDCIYGKDGNLFLSESNVRKTGGTHVYLMAKELFGDDFANKTYAISNNTYQMTGNQQFDFKELHEKLSPILFDSGKKEGLFIVAANLLSRGVFGYVIFGENKERANEIEAQMEALLAA